MGCSAYRNVAKLESDLRSELTFIRKENLVLLYLTSKLILCIKKVILTFNMGDVIPASEFKYHVAYVINPYLVN